MGSFLLLLTSCISAFAGEAETTVKGRITGPQNSQFLYEATSKKKGEQWETSTSYKDLNGKSLVDEFMVTENNKLIRYTYEQHQVGESGRIDLKDGKVFYRFRSGEKEKEDSESITPYMIVPEMVPAILNERWPEIDSGGTVKVRLLLVERLDSFGFKFFKAGERELAGRTVVDITMKPSSFIIAALAPSIRITVEKAAPHSIVETDGRLPIRVPEKDPPLSRRDYKAIDGIVRIEK